MSYPIHVLVHGFFPRPLAVSDIVASIVKTRPKFRLLVSGPGVLVGADLFAPTSTKIPRGSGAVLRYTGFRYGNSTYPEIVPPAISLDTRWVIHKDCRKPPTESWGKGYPWDDVGVSLRPWYFLNELPLAWAHADAGSWANPVGYTVSPSRTPEWEAYDKAIQSAWSAQFKPGGAGETAPPLV